MSLLFPSPRPLCLLFQLTTSPIFILSPCTFPLYDSFGPPCLGMMTFLLKGGDLGAEETARCLKALVLSEDPGSAPSIFLEAHNRP